MLVRSGSWRCRKIIYKVTHNQSFCKTNRIIFVKNMYACACYGNHLHPHFYHFRRYRIPRCCRPVLCYSHPIPRRPHPIPRRPHPIPRRPRRIPRNLRRDGRKVVSAVRYSHFGLCLNCISACNSRFAPRNDSRCHLGHDWRPRRRGACSLCPDGDGGESG